MWRLKLKGPVTVILVAVGLSPGLVGRRASADEPRRATKLDLTSDNFAKLHALIRPHEQEWRRIIARVRAIYRGPVTYGANFDEVFDVKFWDALDWIGVSAYFPLVDDASPDRESPARAWQRDPTRSRRRTRPARYRRRCRRGCSAAPAGRRTYQR